MSKILALVFVAFVAITAFETTKHPQWLAPDCGTNYCQVGP